MSRLRWVNRRAYAVELPVYPGPVRESFVGDILWQGDGVFLRVLRLLHVIFIPQTLHTRLRLNIAVIRRICWLKTGTFKQKTVPFGLSHHFVIQTSRRRLVLRTTIIMMCA